MAKTSVTNTSTWGVPMATALLCYEQVFWRYSQISLASWALPLNALCCILSLHANANWMTLLRAGPQTEHRQSLGGACWEFPFLQGCRHKTAHCDSSDGALQSQRFGVWAWIGWLWNGFCAVLYHRPHVLTILSICAKFPQGHPTPSHSWATLGGKQIRGACFPYSCFVKVPQGMICLSIFKAQQTGLLLFHNPVMQC